jgi:hypothetical protein
MVHKSFSFWPLLFVGVICVVLLLLTILSRKGIRINTFMAMMAVSGMFGMVMVSFALEIAKPITWKDIWRPFVLSMAVVTVCLVSGWLLELGKPDLASE